jgi:hypothetical protein
MDACRAFVVDFPGLVCDPMAGKSPDVQGWENGYTHATVTGIMVADRLILYAGIRARATVRRSMTACRHGGCDEDSSGDNQDSPFSSAFPAKSAPSLQPSSCLFPLCRRRPCELRSSSFRMAGGILYVRLQCAMRFRKPQGQVMSRSCNHCAASASRYCGDAAATAIRCCQSWTNTPTAMMPNALYCGSANTLQPPPTVSGWGGGGGGGRAGAGLAAHML